MIMEKLYFVTGSQLLYGEETLKQVAKDSAEMADYLNAQISGCEIVWKPTVCNSTDAEDIMLQATADRCCIGVIVWMHTFSPAKMWIKGLQALRKPMLHLHTQFGRRLPYESIDMDFMNLHQSAHGDREFGFICTRLGLHREVVAGYYRDEKVIARIQKFADVASAVSFSHRLRVATFGNNMRDVAVTDGDRVESEIRLGWNVNYYGIGDLVDRIAGISPTQIDAKLQEYTEKYLMDTPELDAVRVQAAYEVAIEEFLQAEKLDAFTDTFEDLHGLEQLPGLCVQNLMAKNIGFGPEGDYKTGALMAVLCHMAKNRQGATAFIEDYTYDLTEGNELELAAHMLEVSPVFAKNQPKIQVHPLGIGGKAAPARLVFDGIEGGGIAVSMVDMGDRFRLICAKIALTAQPEPMPHLPVARVMWKILPDFSTGAEAWIRAGGAHHAVVSTSLDVSDIRLFAELMDLELITIGF